MVKVGKKGRNEGMEEQGDRGLQILFNLNRSVRISVEKCFSISIPPILSRNERYNDD